MRDPETTSSQQKHIQTYSHLKYGRCDLKKLDKTAIRTHIQDTLSPGMSNMEITEETDVEDFWISLRKQLFKELLEKKPDTLKRSGLARNAKN